MGAQLPPVPAFEAESVANQRAYLEPVQRELALLQAHSAIFCWELEDVVERLQHMYQSIPELFARR